MTIRIEDLPVEVAQGELVTRYVELGEMAIRHATLPPGTDMGPVLQGLPGDRCPSHHWGIVLDGSIELTHADGTQELACPGEVYHWPRPHRHLEGRRDLPQDPTGGGDAGLQPARRALFA